MFCLLISTTLFLEITTSAFWGRSGTVWLPGHWGGGCQGLLELVDLPILECQRLGNLATVQDHLDVGAFTLSTSLSHHMYTT